MTNNSTAIKTSLLSFVLGDALGLAIQFFTKKTLKEKLQSMSIIEIIENSNSNIPLGTWSDDTSLTLCTIESIIEKNCVDVENISEKFCDWFKNGHLTPFGKAFDIGQTTYKIISDAIKNNKKILTGSSNLYDNGNGSLTRILPVALFCHEKHFSKSELHQTIKNVSSLTHAHPISIIGCYLYTLVVFMILDGLDKKAILGSLKEIKKHFPLKYIPYLSEYEDIFNGDFLNENTALIKSDGYVKDTLKVALWGFFNSHFIEDGIYKTISLGGDTDTNGAVCGGLCGLYYGSRGLGIPCPMLENPTDFTKVIIKKEMITSLFERFVTTISKDE